MRYRFLQVSGTGDALQDYLGFGGQIIARLRYEDKYIAIVQIPEQHAQWQADRLSSGLHFAKIHSAVAVANDDARYFADRDDQDWSKADRFDYVEARPLGASVRSGETRTEELHRTT
jgi:hypothetical protein